MYAPENTYPFMFDDMERHATAMREVGEQVIFEGEEGQRYSGLHVNRDFESQPAIIRINSMFGDSGRIDQKYIAYQYAAAFPERPFVLLDLPSHGNSDNLTPAQSKAIKERADLGQVASSQVKAVGERLPGVQKAALVGEALGARMATEFAGKACMYDIDVTDLLAVDMPGLQKRSSAAIGLGYLGNVLRSRSRYAKGEANQRLNANFTENFSKEFEQYGSVEKTTAAKEAGVWKRDKSLFTFLFRNSPLANDMGYDSLKDALVLNNYLSLGLVFGGHSAVGKYTPQIEAKLTELAKRLPRHKIEWEVWPNDDQGIGYAHHSPRIVRVLRDQIEAQ